MVSGESPTMAMVSRARGRSVIRLLACPVGLFLASQVLAHGTHARFISPDSGALISGALNVRIEKTPRPFPYVHITVRNTATGREEWSGLVPPGDTGYAQTINVEEWEAGTYVIEAQFLGDVVEQVRQRFITVGMPE